MTRVTRGFFVLRRMTLLALLLSLAATGIGVWTITSLQANQERRLLQERTAEVSQILSTSVQAIPDRLKVQGAVLRATNLNVLAYQQAANSDVVAGQGRQSFAWLRPTAGGAFVVVAAQGTSLSTGQVISDERAATMARALTTNQLVPGSVVGADRVVGFALGAPAAPRGTVLYQQSTLGPAVTAPRAAASQTEAFSDLDVGLYASPAEDDSQIVVGTARSLPLQGTVRRQPIPVGVTDWLIVVKARRPLVGSVAGEARLFALGSGLLASVLVTGLVEATGRRRDSALALLENERATAENFQRSLLPTLPELPGLDLAARYVASGRGQQVGGDWFDVFPVAGGRVGIVIGDVMGHDLIAASGMAQVRSALRAYALTGDGPAEVIDRLNAFVTELEVTELVTVVYALLEPLAADGTRLLRWSNAGHLPPLLRAPTGVVKQLAGGESLLIGTGLSLPASSASQELGRGSTLLLFTDGLVEVPGGSLDTALEELSRTIGVPVVDASTLCDLALGTVPAASRRDDIAVLAVHLTG